MWQPKTLSSEQLEERRLAALPLIEAGCLSHAAIARQFGVSRQSVNRWAKRLASGGRQSLNRRSHGGRTARLTEEQWHDLLTVLQQGARPAGFPTQRWTLLRIQRLARERFGVSYSVNYLSERLRHMGWSVQRPEPVPRERDDALVEAWLKGDWPRIKKMLRTGRTELKTSTNCLH